MDKNGVGMESTKSSETKRNTTRPTLEQSSTIYTTRKLSPTLKITVCRHGPPPASRFFRHGDDSSVTDLRAAYLTGNTELWEASNTDTQSNTRSWKLSESQKCWRNNNNTTRIKCAIAPTRKTLNWRTMFSQCSVHLCDFNRLVKNEAFLEDVATQWKPQAFNPTPPFSVKDIIINVLHKQSRMQYTVQFLCSHLWPPCYRSMSWFRTVPLSGLETPLIDSSELGMPNISLRAVMSRELQAITTEQKFQGEDGRDNFFESVKGSKIRNFCQFPIEYFLRGVIERKFRSVSQESYKWRQDKNRIANRRTEVLGVLRGDIFVLKGENANMCEYVVAPECKGRKREIPEETHRPAASSVTISHVRIQERPRWKSNPVCLGGRRSTAIRNSLGQKPIVVRKMAHRLTYVRKRGLCWTQQASPCRLQTKLLKPQTIRCVPNGAQCVQWIEHTPPTKVSRVRVLAGLLLGYLHVKYRWSAGFLGDLPFTHSSAAPYSRHFTFIGSQDLDVKSSQNLCTHLEAHFRHTVKNCEYEGLDSTSTSMELCLHYSCLIVVGVHSGIEFSPA
ncbi:hypothetical protein PR048_020721 [Dryococelus australis]|uniref:Uncharacterized protein n=1 Tax=Dryococelus australis TaxID=614101 RepID=A0ABQ9H721_9NEOP|nr:hypothetical protein PR048_020721 [Dryococelus australis]